MADGARDREAEEFDRLVRRLDDVAENGRRIIARTPARRIGLNRQRPDLHRPNLHRLKSRGGPRSRTSRRRPRNLVSWLAVLVVVLTAGFAGYRDVFPGPPAPGEGYAFVGTRPDGSPLRYRCEPIAVVNVATGMPTEGEAALDGALSRVSGASGVDLVRVPSLEAAGGRPVIRVSWATEEEDEQLAGKTAGYAGSQPAGDGWFTHGSVVMDADAHRGDARALELILMHELAHTLGLDHVDDPDQLMHPEYTDQNDWGQGDLAGLAQVGCTAG